MSLIIVRLRMMVVVVGCAAFLASCGSNIDDTEAGAGATTGSDAAAESSPSGADAAAQEPGDQQFPIPTPDGGERITDGWNGTTGYITVRYPADRYDEIVAFYDDYARGDGWRRKELGQGEPRTINYMNLMDGLNVSVDPPTGDTLTVTLMVS